MTTFYGSLALTFRDYKGYTGVTRVLGAAASEAALITAVDAVGAAMDAASNAFLGKQTGVNIGFEIAVTYGAAAQYADIAQRLVIRGLDTSGRIHRISVPAPKVEVFLTDQVTFDVGSTLGAPIVTALNACWVSNDASTLPITVIDGTFVDRRKKKKLGPWTRTPTGAAAGG